MIKAIKKEIRTLLYWGNKSSCNFCGRSFKEFLSFGVDEKVIVKEKIIGAGRRKASCPRCNSTDRERLILLYLRKETNIFNGEQPYKILHVAPERKIALLLRKQKNVDYTCGDLFTEGYEHDYLPGTLNLDITKTDFLDNTFDFVICNHVLEHIPDDLSAMKEINRILTPGGKAVLQVPISETLAKTYEDFSIVNPEKRLDAFGQKDHVRIYGQDYIEKLKRAFNDVDKINFYKIDNSRLLVEKFGINPKEDLYIAKK